MMLNNPFITNGYAGPEYFCDRKDETRKITDLLVNENNLALMSPRRIGKTELINHCFNQPEIKQDYYTFIIDIYSTSSVSDLVNVFGKSIIDGLRSKGKKVWEKLIQTLASLRSEISFDINGLPVWSVGVGAITNPEVTLDEIFTYLQQADKPCLVAIDEFQQITYYGDNRIEALLRTYIQRCTNAHFIFSGSHRHLMGEIFVSPSRPFYQSVTLMNLKTLTVEKYSEFASEKFEERNKHLEVEIIKELFNRFEGVTSYIQRVMNVLFLKTPQNGTCSKGMLDDAINYILDMSSDTYETILRQMAEKQRNTILAIAAEGKARNVTGGIFAKKHHLPSPSSVNSAVKGLLEKDFITENDGAYSVYDQFFSLWIKKYVLGNTTD
ncbi:ATPase [Prevotella herbatica]|uniref:ATPase n=2 Tax=Prevotella herbatica TaxID=2801997 RepID=A0ABN6EG40_9BACT|nr:ATPase [Prevotella herbatica]